MASLRDLAARALHPLEQPVEQDLEHLEQGLQAFQGPTNVPDSVEHQNPRKTAKNGPCSTVPVLRERNAGTLAEITDRLGRLACPSGLDPAVWRGVVVDARTLIAEGWAAQALKLGWEPLDLFGAVPEANGDPNADGLAVKLNGRRVVGLCAAFASVADANGGRTFIYRGDNSGARLLWELGRGR